MITDFLVEALQERPNVQVPGLGTFTSQPLSAVLDEDTNIIKPPSAEIVFIDDVGYGDVDDSIITFILNKTDMPKEEVEEQIAALGDEVKSKVNDGETFEINGLGTFEKGIYGNIVFKNNPDSFTGSSYGLPKLSITPLDEATLAARGGDSSTEEEGNKFPEATLWGILIPSIIIVLVAVWLMLDKSARDKAMSFISGEEKTEQVENVNPPVTDKKEEVADNKEADKTTDDQGTSANNNEANENENTADATKQENNSEAIAKENTTTNTTATGDSKALISDRTGRYYLSIASYPNEKAAMTRRQRLISQGYTDAKVVAAGGNKYRVSLADFASRADANKKVAEAKGDYDSIWVFKY